MWMILSSVRLIRFLSLTHRLNDLVTQLTAEWRGRISVNNGLFITVKSWMHYMTFVSISSLKESTIFAKIQIWSADFKQSERKLHNLMTTWAQTDFFCFRFRFLFHPAEYIKHFDIELTLFSFLMRLFATRQMFLCKLIVFGMNLIVF